MRTCPYCNCYLGEQEQGVIVAGAVVHSLCEAPYKKELADKAAKLTRHRFLYLPSLGPQKAGDEL